MIPTSSYSPDSKEAEYIEALYSDKPAQHPYFNRNSYLKDPSIHLDETEPVIDLTNNAQTLSSLERIKISSAENLLIHLEEEDHLSNERPHSEFFNGNADMDEHFRKIASERGDPLPVEIKDSPVSSVEDEDSAHVFGYKHNINVLEKSMPMGELTDSVNSFEKTHCKFLNIINC